MSAPVVTVIQNSAGSGPGRLVDWLSAEGLSPDLIRADQGEPVQVGVDSHGLILLGGGLLPDSDDRAPWLPDERLLAVAAVEAELPLWGICLGAQLLAQVTGGTVTAESGETERGSCPVDLLPAAQTDPLFGSFAESHLWMIQNHVDSITALDPAAVLLASSSVCSVEAFRVGRCAWGVQFHPEVGAARLQRWDESAMSPTGLNREQMIAQAQTHEADNARQSRQLVHAFAAQVSQHAGG